MEQEIPSLCKIFYLREIYLFIYLLNTSTFQIRNLQSDSQDKSSPLSHFLVNKEIIYKVTPSPLHIARGCLPTTKAELNNCDRHWSEKPKVFI